MIEENIDCFPLAEKIWLKITSSGITIFKKNTYKYSGTSRSFERFVWTLFSDRPREKALNVFKWILKVFTANRKPCRLISAIQKITNALASHIDLKKWHLKTKFSQNFSIILANEFKILSNKEKLVSEGFSTTFLFEEVLLSAYTDNKRKCRIFLNAQPAS